ncbi:uncharacterized protein CANTADRAFT_90186 [Suhomyces tanzawaensis NRRL Y-17324]|uniref:Uncharacterized protein n=1 Tax=Suhomyces tanzawaensis NRRL Y-17324 TaxID=984487 RepID=A0A1E4SHU1_9ASCO|nr:uncharacterized protein CANTADRAFT_90186 [Suhomyces tanzawaensis NRRL Y-17324]ODV79071.1 hypothetical protein CANTADRAFT_90186 [Suhomyces tanzawaensis NRRL Y-17324]
MDINPARISDASNQKLDVVQALNKTSTTESQQAKGEMHSKMPNLLWVVILELIKLNFAVMKL